jgi:hypothetical protein
MEKQIDNQVLDQSHQTQAIKPLELRERLNLAKEKKALLIKKDEDHRKIKCFRCQEMGHHQKDYQNTPICYKCKEEGCMAVECLDFHTKAGELKMHGFALADLEFYSIKMPEEGEISRASCIIQILQGEASVKKLEDELKNLVNRQWDWQVK